MGRPHCTVLADPTPAVRHRILSRDALARVRYDSTRRSACARAMGRCLRPYPPSTDAHMQAHMLRRATDGEAASDALLQLLARASLVDRGEERLASPLRSVGRATLFVIKGAQERFYGLYRKTPPQQGIPGNPARAASEAALQPLVRSLGFGRERCQRTSNKLL